MLSVKAVRLGTIVAAMRAPTVDRPVETHWRRNVIQVIWWA